MNRAEDPIPTDGRNGLGAVDGAMETVFDRIVAAATLFVLAPVMLCTWIYVTLLNPRRRAVETLPRIGQQGQPFELLKFRTPKYARGQSLLGTYGLVHLPELVNVLRGEMSLVGPRPRPLPGVHGSEAADSAVLDLRPGMTGLWMLTNRTELTPDDLVDLDRVYAESWSLARDIRILINTAAAVRYRTE
jgi:lipopolysaccharide/colanic/teichoic acid biosynthesis glycosyltransferase